MFWVFTGIFGSLDLIITHDPLNQVSGMKNKVPGTPLAGAAEGEYAYYLLGGDNLARDVFSRMVKGAWVVVQIAPLATLFAFMVGITLGLPAGYYGGRLDTFLSFLANLILAFPVILLFYLLVTPEIVDTGIPNLYGGGPVHLPAGLCRHPAELALLHPAEFPHTAVDRGAGGDGVGLPVADFRSRHRSSICCPDFWTCLMCPAVSLWCSCRWCS